MTAKYTLHPAYCRHGDLYTADEARVFFVARHGDGVTLRETANGTLIRLFVDRPFGLVVGERVA